jgi:hypothetical protein
MANKGLIDLEESVRNFFIALLDFGWIFREQCCKSSGPQLVWDMGMAWDGMGWLLVGPVRASNLDPLRSYNNTTTITTYNTL